MKSRSQRTETKRQESGVRGQTFDLQTLRPSTACRRAGFTLVEVMMASVISVMVFVAMGHMLTKCFSLWKDSTANWRLAQVARISRERILCGGFTDPSGGLLSATNATLNPSGGWGSVDYKTAAGAGVLYQIRGWPGIADENILLNKGASSVYGQGSGDANPEIKVDSFVASVTNDLVKISYRLRLSAAGKTFTLPHTIQACLVNKEN